jgi:hypothetical protein
MAVDEPVRVSEVRKTKLSKDAIWYTKILIFLFFAG